MKPLLKIYRTFIFEDQFFDLAALKAILVQIPGIQIIGDSASLSEAIAECARMKPDLIIADAEIHGDKKAGSRFVQTVREQLPQVHILGLTRYPECIDGLKRAGCDRVVNKNLIDSPEACVNYIRDCFIPKPTYYSELQPPVLIPEEDRVLKSICDGKTEDEIATEMGFSTRKPIRKIKNSLFAKFGAINVPNLVDLAYKTGYRKPDDD
jgi:DNA-binding NarL/FixJ family response regulator